MLYKSIGTIRKVDTANAGKSTDKDVLQFAGQAKVRFIPLSYNIFIACQTLPYLASYPRMAQAVNFYGGQTGGTPR